MDTRTHRHAHGHSPTYQSTHIKLHNPSHWKARKEGEVMVVVEKMKVGSVGGGGGSKRRGGQGEKEWGEEGILSRL